MEIKKNLKFILGPRLSRKAAMLKSSATMLRTEKIIKTFDGSGLKLVGFIKSFNDGENGNLERCLKHRASHSYIEQQSKGEEIGHK